MLLRVCCDGFAEAECEEVAGAEKAQEARAQAFEGVEEAGVRPQMRPEPCAHRHAVEPLDLQDIELGHGTAQDSPNTGLRVSKGSSRGASTRNLQRKVAFQSESPKSGGTETTAPTTRSSGSQLSDSDTESAGEDALREGSGSRFTKYKGTYEASSWRFQATLDCGRITVHPWGRVTGEVRFRCLKAPEHVPDMVGRLGVEYFEGHWSPETQTILAKGVRVSDVELLRVTWSYVFFFCADCVRGAIDGRKFHLPVWNRPRPVRLPPSGSQSGSRASSPSAGRSRKATEPMAPQMKPMVVPAATQPAPAPLAMPGVPLQLVKPTAPNKLPLDMDWKKTVKVRKGRPQPAALNMELLYDDAPFDTNTLASVKLDKEIPIPAPIVPRPASAHMRARTSSPRHKRTKAFWDRGD